MHVSRKKIWFAAGTVVAGTALGGGIAFATWSVNGSGEGGAAATVVQNLVVTAITPSGAGAALYPGGPAGWVYMTIHNPNPFAVTVTGISWGTPLSTDTTTCPNANISLDPGAPSAINVPIAANTTSAAVQVFNVLDLAHSAPDGCQGVGFDVPVTVTGVQQ